MISTKPGSRFLNQKSLKGTHRTELEVAVHHHWWWCHTSLARLVPLCTLREGSYVFECHVDGGIEMLHSVMLDRLAYSITYT